MAMEELERARAYNRRLAVEGQPVLGEAADPFTTRPAGTAGDADIADDDLAADAKLPGQGGGADGLMGFVEPDADPAPALFGGHEEDSLRFFFYHTRFPGPWQVFL